MSKNQTLTYYSFQSQSRPCINLPFGDGRIAMYKLTMGGEPSGVPCTSERQWLLNTEDPSVLKHLKNTKKNVETWNMHNIWVETHEEIKKQNSTCYTCQVIM